MGIDLDQRVIEKYRLSVSTEALSNELRGEAKTVPDDRIASN